MSGTVFFSFVLFLGSEWGVEPHSISMTEGTITSILSWQLEGWKTHREPQPGRLVGPSCRGWDGVENGFPSSSKHLDEDLAKLFDEILLQVFPSHLDDVSKDATTAGRLITWSDVNETQLSPNSFNNSELASSSHKQEEHLAKIFGNSFLLLQGKGSMFACLVVKISSSVRRPKKPNRRQNANTGKGPCFLRGRQMVAAGYESVRTAWKIVPGLPAQVLTLGCVGRPSHYSSENAASLFYPETLRF